MAVQANKPWSGLIPPEDVASFRAGHADPDRQLQAGSKPALIIVDMTKAFVDSAYPTGWSDTGAPAAAANKTLLAEAREAQLPIYFTKSYPSVTHQPRLVERGRWKRPRSDSQAVAPSSPRGDVIVDELTPLQDEVTICKGNKPSAFFGTPLVSYLVYQNVDTVIITGMTTSGCVRATVLDAFQYNFSVVVPHECTADRSQISHRVSLFDMHMKYADVVSLGEVLSYIKAL